METIKQAIEFHKKGDYQNAERFYLLFLDKNPEEAKAHHLLGAMYMQIANYKKAIKSLSAAYKLDKTLPVKTDYALCLYEIQEFEKALILLLEILEENAGKILYEKALDCALKIDFAEKYLKLAAKYLELFEEDINILRNAAGYALDLGELETAEKYYKRILEIFPDDHIALNNLALVYEFKLDFNLAEKCYRKAIEIKPNLDPVYNLSVLLRRRGKFDESLEYLELSRKYGLTDIGYDCGLGLHLLAQRDFSGFKPYLNFVKYRHPFLKHSPWDGKADKSKLLLLCTTEGFGDIFMFSRYLDFVDVKSFRDVLLAVPDTVLELFAFNFPDFKVLDAQKQIPYDVNDIVMNLPNVFNLDFDHIPSSAKYLMAPPVYTAKWQNYFNKEKYNVGLFYSGNFANKRSLRNRCVDFKFLEPLFDIEGVKYYSLQPEKCFSEEIEMQNKKTGNAEALFDKIENFSDTAGIIENLDLIISIDSSVANLAGAMGKKTFMLLPKSADWRWFNDDKNTPWYDSVEIFKQTNEGEWQEPVARIKKALEEEIKKDGRN